MKDRRELELVEVRYLTCKIYHLNTRSQESPSGAGRERRQAFPGLRTNFNMEI